MEILIFLIPFIVAIILLVWFRKETIWYEYILLIVPSLLIALLLEFIFKCGNCSDTEYLGGYITSIRYYEPWNEWHHRTCHRYVRRGKSSVSIPYDCSYCEEHPSRWTYVTNNGNEEYFSDEKEFNVVCKRFNVKSTFVDMNRNYYTKDGDMYEWKWDGNIEKSYTLTNTHSYQNPIKGSRSIFKFEEISEEEAKNLGLYDYNDLYIWDQSPIYGHKLPQNEEQYIRWINGSLGEEKQVRMNILFFKNKSEVIAEEQKSYWEGGNKNEVTCCIGIDKSNKIAWVKCFSWEDAPIIAISAQNWLLTHPFKAKEFYNYITPIIKKQWKRKEFEDFSYLSIEISDTEYIIILILILIYNISISIWIITNDFRNDDETKSYYLRNYY